MCYDSVDTCAVDGTTKMDSLFAVVQKGRFQAPSAGYGFTFTSRDVRIKDGTLVAPNTSQPEDLMETSVKQIDSNTHGR